MDLSFHSEEAKEVNKLIFETIYHASLEKSNEISIERAKIIQELFNSIKAHIADFIYKNNNSIPRCQDKPFIVYNTITRKIYDNVTMKKYCVNNPDTVSS